VIAALLVRPGVLVVDDVKDPAPGPDDVVVAVDGVGLCGSDVSVFRGVWPAPSLPWILGHEAFGRIETVGERVSAARVGELVVIEPNIACLRCGACRSGRTSTCTQRQSIGMNRPGALADKVVVPGAYAWQVGELGATDLVCIEPLTVAESALRRLGTPLPASALIVGVGPQGLLMCLALLRRGVRVHAFDLNTNRLALATSLGARQASTDDAAPRFDLVVDTVGSPESIETALRHIETSGTLLVVGLDGRPFEIAASTLVRRQLVIRGSLTYEHPLDFRSVVDLVQRGAVSPGRIVSDEYPLADVQRAFESSAFAQGKTWIRVRPAGP
jgi:2-desacetyl-2-hydroxyethyl bacteriochlorophyllide A dehydrogenase